MTEKEPDHIIEPGVPIPGRRHAYDRYHFGTMEVGDSFKVKAGIDNLNRCRSAASRYHQNHPEKKFTVRTVDPVKNIYRCWRIA